MTYEYAECFTCEKDYRRHFLYMSKCRIKWYLDDSGRKTRGNKCFSCLCDERKNKNKLRGARMVKAGAYAEHHRELVAAGFKPPRVKPCGSCGIPTTNYYNCSGCWNSKPSLWEQDVLEFTAAEKAAMSDPAAKFSGSFSRKAPK